MHKVGLRNLGVLEHEKQLYEKDCSNSFFSLDVHFTQDVVSAVRAVA